MTRSKIAYLVGSAAMALIAQHAQAQSSVTLYGVADVSIRYLTHANANNDNQVLMTNGAITNSRWGLKGTEDLGGGLKAIFRLESGIDLQDGQGASREFNRGAYVGLASNQYGTVTLGRQMTPLFDALGNTFDPLTVGNYMETEWLPVAAGAGLYADNAVKYVGTYGGFTVDAMYSFGTNSTSTGATGFSGQTPGHMGAGNLYAFNLSYVFGALSLDVGVQQNSDNAGNKQTGYNGAAVYAFSTAKVYLGYLRSKDNTGFSDAFLDEKFTTSGFGSYKNTGRIDDGPYAGVTWNITPALMLTGAFYYDHMRNATVSVNAAGNANALGSGNRYTATAIAEYALSKRTEVYGAIDFNKVSGAATVELPGTSNQTGVSIGIRNIF